MTSDRDNFWSPQQRHGDKSCLRSCSKVVFAAKPCLFHRYVFALRLRWSIRRLDLKLWQRLNICSVDVCFYGSFEVKLFYTGRKWNTALAKVFSRAKQLTRFLFSPPPKKRQNKENLLSFSLPVGKCGLKWILSVKKLTQTDWKLSFRWVISHV